MSPVVLLLASLHPILTTNSLYPVCTFFTMLRLPRFASIIVCVLCAVVSLHAGITVVDDLGRSITLSAPAQRIVSLAPSITETLFALDGGSQVVGVTDYCNYPAAAKSKQHVGGIVNPSIETIIALKPDLILLSMEGNVREDFTKLESMGIPLFVTNPRTLQGIRKSINDLGVLTGRTKEAATLAHSMQAVEDSVTALVTTKKRVLHIVSLQPLIVVGGRTFLNELIERAGGINIAADAASTYPTLSREAVVARDPDIIIVMSDILAKGSDLTSFFPEWATLRALRTNSVFTINADIVSRPGPRAADGLLHLHRIIQEGQE
jgi:iron complex transport system substrate-binding protein